MSLPGSHQFLPVPSWSQGGDSERGWGQSHLPPSNSHTLAPGPSPAAPKDLGVGGNECQGWRKPSPLPPALPKKETQEFGRGPRLEQRGPCAEACSEKQPLPCQDKRCFSTPFFLPALRMLFLHSKSSKFGEGGLLPGCPHALPGVSAFPGAAEEEPTPNPSLEFSLLSTPQHCSPPPENPPVCQQLPAAPTSLCLETQKMGRTKDLGQFLCSIPAFRAAAGAGKG